MCGVPRPCCTDTHYKHFAESAEQQLCTQVTEHKGKCGIDSSLQMLNSSVFPSFFLSFSLSFFLLFYPRGRKGPINCRLIYCPVWHDAFLPLEPVFEATFPFTLCLQPALTSSEHPLLLPPSRSPPPLSAPDRWPVLLRKGMKDILYLHRLRDFSSRLYLQLFVKVRRCWV